MKLIGLARLGRDGELRRLPSGEAVINLALAYNYGKKVDGNQPTQWVEAAFWGSRAEALAQWLVKGQQFLIEVRDIHIETYQAKDSSTGSKLVGTVDNIEFAGPAPAGNGGGQQQGNQQQQRQQAPQGNGNQGGNNNGGYGAPQQRQQPAQQQRPAPQQSGGGASGFDDFGSEDIPF